MTTLPDRLVRIRDFLLLCDRFKTIRRRSYLADGTRRETDAEHAWHMALYALLLRDELEQPVDLGQVLALVAVHDLVEILAGDTYAYDDTGRKDQAAREAAAAERLFGLLPEDLRDRLQGLWRTFETAQSPEARFARALDRLQALGQSIASGGRAWREHNVTRVQVETRMRTARDVDPVFDTLIDSLLAEAERRSMWSATPASDDPH